jgi:pimeloyl-ACP methyl ester carboxylesterase
MNKITYPFPVHHLAIHNGIDIAFCDEGKGENTLLFIHGLANYAPVWNYQIDGLKNNARCIAIDLPGNGLSSRGDYPYTMFFYAECIVKFMEQMELKNVMLCGHSMGGQISIIIALRYPHLLKKLILIAPAGLEYFYSHEVMMIQHTMNMGGMFYSDEMNLESAIKQSFFSTKNESHKIISDLKHIMQNYSSKQFRDMSTLSIKGMLNEQVNQFLQNIICPTLIIFGEQDQLIPNKLIHFSDTPESIAKYAGSIIPNATVKLIPQAGHFVNIEKYEEVNEAIKRFVN